MSHELKTPITILKGQLEGMLYQVGEYKDRDAYLRLSLKTTKDMEDIVKEILSAARMGSSSFHIKTVDLDISEVVKKCCHRVLGIIEDKNMKLSLNMPQDFHYKGDAQLLEKAFSNIISNAVSYSPKGAEIMISLKDRILSFENTGVYINDEDLSQLFVPFYRVDKSRNHNTGGSGLGLYIVKTIFDLHKLPFHMENTQRGVQFKLYFNNI